MSEFSAEIAYKFVYSIHTKVADHKCRKNASKLQIEICFNWWKKLQSKCRIWKSMQVMLQLIAHFHSDCSFFSLNAISLHVHGIFVQLKSAIYNWLKWQCACKIIAKTDCSRITALRCVSRIKTFIRSGAIDNRLADSERRKYFSTKTCEKLAIELQHSLPFCIYFLQANCGFSAI